MKQLNLSFPSRMLFLVVGLMLSLGAMAQIVCNGHVKDATGEPVIGATIRISGQDGGTISDFDGNFTLKAKQGTAITVSYIGYKDATVAAAPKMDILLEEDGANSLNEVVVIGYGVAKKNDLTGSVTAIKPDEKNHALVTNAQDMIQGKIAGVNVVTSGGAPGTGATIRIRGGSSLNASNDPLIVIDGLAMDAQGIKGSANPLSMVNPNDIESFTVLKDASATAIYGSRGSNGVIIITTKKGRKDMAPQVSYNGNVSMSMRAKSLDVLNADEYRAFIKNYYGEDSDAAALLGKADTDWQDEIYRTGVSSDHNITVQGGLGKMPYRFSAGYTDQNGILKTSNFQRTTASLNLSPSFLEDHLKFNVNGKFMYSHTRYANTDAIGEAVRMDPTQPVTSTGDLYRDFNGYFAWANANAASNYGYIQNTNAAKNPVALLNEKNSRANSFDYMGNVEVDYQVHGLEDLRFHMNFSGDWANGKQNTDYADWGPTNTYWGNTGYDKENKYNLIYSAYAQYYKDFSETQHFDVMAGYEWSHTKYWGNKLYYDTKSVEGKSAAQIAGMKPADYHSYTDAEWKQESYLVSFYGRMNYIAFDRYMVTATVRRDGSSRFKQHWATFPSVALGWKINEEAFLKNVESLDELKLRLGWGMTGQQDGIGNYNYFASYNVNTNYTDGRYPINGVNNSGIMYRPDAYNANLKWETTTTWNAGLDVSLFRGRISASVDYYYRKTTDLINDSYVSAGSNFKNKVRSNIGSLTNQGVEASVTFRPVQTKDWQWEITMNGAYNKNEITELTGESAIVRTGGISAGTGNQCQVQMVGKPRNTFYVYQQVYDSNGKPIEGVYVDRNADGKISEDDLYPYKSPDAPWTAGLSTRVQYKNWDLGCSFHAKFDNYVFNDRLDSYSNISKRYDSSYNYLQNVMPVAVENNWATYDNCLSDYFVQNASFVKLDNITLGYSFNSLFNGGSYKGMSGRLYFTASNVATWTNYTGLDPEVDGGIDNNIYPRPFSMTMGVSLNF